MMTAPTSALEPFLEGKTVLLTTYKRDGTGVGTPVHIALHGARRGQGFLTNVRSRRLKKASAFRSPSIIILRINDGLRSSFEAKSRGRG